MVSDPLRPGRTCIRFAVSKNDHHDPETFQRSEVAIPYEMWHAAMFHAYSYSFETLIRASEWIPRGDTWLSVAQWRDIPDGYPTAQVEPWRYAILALYVINDKWKIVYRSDANATTPYDYADAIGVDWQGHIDSKSADTKWWEQPFAASDFDAWIKWEFRVLWSYKTDEGRLDVYKNNVRVLEYRGAIGYNDVRGPTSRFGIYRSGPHPYAPYQDRVLYVSDYVVAM